MKKTLILYPHQLYSLEHLPDNIDKVIMVEEPLLFGYDAKFPVNMHVQKLVLHRATMRRYVEEILWPAKIDVDYVETDNDWWSGKALNIAAGKDNEIYVFDPTDDVLYRRLKRAEGELPSKVQVHWLDSPNFYLSRAEAGEYFQAKKKHFFADFYQWQRERYGILLTKNFKPVGGKWSFDAENRKKLRKGTHVPSPTSFGNNKYVEEAKEYVNKKFSHQHGSVEEFIWPTNTVESLSWLDEFIELRLEQFGSYEDAIEPQHDIMFHSAITPMLNIGLLNPKQVIEAVLDKHARKPVKLSSLEGFVRQVLGWREYMRGIYLYDHISIRNGNFFKHERHLTADWYDGTTGLQPLDDVINKAQRTGYLHHIERLMIAGNAMLLSEITPDEVYKWFMEMTIDAYDWVMVPNVYGMSQYADGGSMVTKPYISGSNYIKTMSHYDKEDTWDDWHTIWDGLYWRFIDSHRSFFKKNPRMSAMVAMHDKMDEDKRRVLGYRAGDFLASKTKKS